MGQFTAASALSILRVNEKKTSEVDIHVTYTEQPPKECPTATNWRPEKPKAALDCAMDGDKRGMCVGMSS